VNTLARRPDIRKGLKAVSLPLRSVAGTPKTKAGQANGRSADENRPKVPSGLVPNPPGATVEIQQVTGRDPELLRHRALLDAVCKAEFHWSAGRFEGRGIVICGGGEKYFPSVYVLVRLLRHFACALPIEVWHLGADEMPDAQSGLLAEHGALCVDGLAVRRLHPARRLGGWELKCHALLHCAFAEVLMLDADNCPVRDPSFLFDAPEYGKTGAVFWPDYKGFARGQAVWEASGIPYRDEPEFESAQILINKARCWRALNIAMHLNEHSDWWYRLVHGDKDTFHLAWRKIGQTYAMPKAAPLALESTILQHDFAGERLFQHRNFAKWTLEGNPRIVGFQFEKECLRFIAALRRRLAPRPPQGVRCWNARKADPEMRAIARTLCAHRWDYARTGLDSRPLRFRSDGAVGEGMAGCERWWNLRRIADARGRPGPLQIEVFGDHGLTFHVRRTGRTGWRGTWVIFERTAVTLKPIPVCVKPKVERAALAMAVSKKVPRAKRQMPTMRQSQQP
jgi:hypothetical protein